jgi:APA family basic amino acid/polyamine antiporter
LTSLQIIAVMMIVIITTINCASVAVSGQLATYFTVIKIGLILLVGFGAFHFRRRKFRAFRNGKRGRNMRRRCRIGEIRRQATVYAAGFGAAMLGALWGYDGWNNLTLVAGEVKNPQRNIPIALDRRHDFDYSALCFINIAYFYVLRPDANRLAFQKILRSREVAIRFLGAGAIVLMTAGLMASSIGTLHTSILTGARVPYAMAQDGLMFQSLGQISEGTRVPVGALLVQGIWACLLAISGSFDTLTDYVVFGSWIFYALVTASVFVFRRKFPMPKDLTKRLVIRLCRFYFYWSPAGCSSIRFGRVRFNLLREFS